MYLWYIKCCTSSLYPTRGLIQEEALLMKEKMIETNPELDEFRASNHSHKKPEQFGNKECGIVLTLSTRIS